MNLTKLLFVFYLVLVNPSLLSIFSVNVPPRWRFKAPSFLMGGIDMQFHNDELIKILNEKKPQGFKFLRHRGTSIPRYFDAREKWPMCKDVINYMIKQINTTVSWAVVPASVTYDRSCIASEGKRTIKLALLELIRCCDTCHPYSELKNLYETRSNLITTFFFMKRVGVVNDECIPTKNRYISSYNCQNHCESKQVPFVRFKISNIIIGAKSRRKFRVRDMQVEIKTNGPIGGMLLGIPKDFLHNYTDQVYTSNGKNLIEDSAHAIRIVGWGTERRVPYWLCANSWGESWGKLGGFFKIRRGRNELGIEEFVIAPDPHVGTKELAHDAIFGPTGEVKNGTSCIKTTQLYKTIVIVLIIFNILCTL